MGRHIESKEGKHVDQQSNELAESFALVSPVDARTVILQGEVNEHSISNVIVQLLYLANQNHKPIYLVLSTYGGAADEMMSLYDVIKFLPCEIHTIALGKVMSAGILLLAAGEKGHRCIGRSARLMIHPAAGGIEGNVFELMAEVSEMKRVQDLMVSSLKRETKMTDKDLSAIMQVGYDYYMTPEQAIKMGIVDKIIGA